MEKIHSIAKDGGYILNIRLSDWMGDVASIKLPFSLGGQDTKYSLWVQKDGALSPLETSLGADAASGLPFSTHDQDNDRKNDINCAKQLSGELKFPSSMTDASTVLIFLLRLNLKAASNPDDVLPQVAGGLATAVAPT